MNVKHLLATGLLALTALTIPLHASTLAYWPLGSGDYSASLPVDVVGGHDFLNIFGSAVTSFGGECWWGFK